MTIGLLSGCRRVHRSAAHRVVLQRYARIAAGHRRRVSLRHQHFNLPTQRHDLLRAEPLLRHDLSSFPSSFPHNAWSKKARSGHNLNEAKVRR